MPLRFSRHPPPHLDHVLSPWAPLPGSIWAVQPSTPPPNTHHRPIGLCLWSKHAHWRITQRTSWTPAMQAAQPRAVSVSCFQPHLHQPLGLMVLERGLAGLGGRPCLGISRGSQCWEMHTHVCSYTCTHAHTHSHKPAHLRPQP